MATVTYAERAMKFEEVLSGHAIYVRADANAVRDAICKTYPDVQPNGKNSVLVPHDYFKIVTKAIEKCHCHWRAYDRDWADSENNCPLYPDGVRSVTIRPYDIKVL